MPTAAQDVLSLLHPSARAWIAARGWTSLRPVQAKAIPPIMACDRDVVIAAATAAGKTEAAFLPACSRLAAAPREGVGILYLSPLKALINDQRARLASLGAAMGIPVMAWHGDVEARDKGIFLSQPSGILLITPESLESFLARRGAWCQEAFAGLEFVVIDEFHAFTDTERGRQLLSLLRRVDILARRLIPRVALSATLGSPEDAGRALRPHADGFPCELVSDDGEGREPLLELRGYCVRPPYIRPGGRDVPDPERERLTGDMFACLRGTSSLVFAGSRAHAERLAGALRARCRLEGVENEFFPHHGSLAPSLRQDLERRLREGERPATAVCTVTLELGVDIGCVDSIAQLNAPASVSGLRQRLGRAGRRGARPTLRLFITENWLVKGSSLSDRLRLELFQSVAMLGLLERRWYEPAAQGLPHYSTMVQQVLSLTAQYGGVRPSQLWGVLCQTGPFPVSSDACVTLLRGLVERGLLAWSAEEKLMRLTDRAWTMVEAMDFPNAFRTPDSYAVVCGERALGSLPMTAPLETGQHILLAGSGWSITAIDGQSRRIEVEPASWGVPPQFAGHGQDVHSAVRQEMRRLYMEGRPPAFCDGQARRLFREGLRAFAEENLSARQVVRRGRSVAMLPWLGDRAVRTITHLLRRRGLDVDAYNGIIDARGCTVEQARRELAAIHAAGRPGARSFAAALPEGLRGKYDEWVDAGLRAEDAAARYFDIDAAWDWIAAQARQG